jgi:hypothetical protein
VWPLTTFRVLAAASAWQQYILPGVLTLLGAVAVALLALRGTFKTAQANHETEFDKLVHARIAALEAQVTRLETLLETRTADRDRYRELNAQLRVAFRVHGLDPDDPEGVRRQAGGVDA